MKSFINCLLYLLAVILLAGGSLFCDLFQRRDLVLPRTVLADMDLTGLSHDELRRIWAEHFAEFMGSQLQLAVMGEVKQVTPQELNVKINEADLFSLIPFASSMSNIEIVFWSLAGQRIYPEVMLERADVLRVIEEKFPQIPKTENAHFVLSGPRLEITEAKTGMELMAEPLIYQIKQNTAFFDSFPLFAEFRETQPTVTQLDIEGQRENILGQFPKKLTLIYENQKWTADFQKHPDWIAFERRTVTEWDELPFLLKWEPVAFANFVNDSIRSDLEQRPEGIRIWKDSQGKIQFEGHEKEGRAIDRGKLLAMVNAALFGKAEEVEIPVVVLKPQIEISEDLQTMGVRELIGVGYTRYEGSPANRMHNINAGVNKFNGLLIAPGETFSFAANIGEVDDTTGFKKELVIKPEGTIPEFGGGLCQVSTTMYRAALYSGLPIVERKPHSYVVRYYSQVGGHGLDATVYPPAPDLKFLNDTPGYILIHSYAEGVSAYFKFFGVSDGRQVSLEGPYISNRRSAPADPMLIPDRKLKSGERKQVEKPHDGFDAVWYRYITKNGETVKETLVSRYQAMPAKFLVGGEQQAESSVAPKQPAANPFE